MKSNKKDDRKIYITFFVVMAVLYGAGYLVGKFIARGEKSGSLEAVLEVLKNRLLVIVPPFYFVLAIAFLIVVCVLYMACRRMYQRQQEHPENDDLWDSLEDKLNWPLILSNTMQIINIFFFGCVIWLAEFNSYGRNGGYEMVIVIADSALFFVILAVGMLIPKGVVDIEKKLNPEKQGNVFDFQFNEVWLSSCDEAQQMLTYKAAYKAFMDTNYVGIALYLITFLGMFIFKKGVSSMLCVCIIMVVNNLSYMLRAAKLERG